MQAFNQTKGAGNLPHIKKKENKKMRAIRYYVINKSTSKAVFTDCRENECKKFIEQQENPANFVIGYKWLSL